MIINIRGTHGSGKSTIVRNIMNTYPTREEICTAIRRRPWGYICKDNGKPEVFVPGHYETACGGCDTIPVVEDFYNMIRKHASEKRHVLFEGILAQHYALKKFLTLKPFKLEVLILSTPLEQCIADTKKRRDEAGKPTDEFKYKKISDTIEREHHGVKIKIAKLKANGVSVRVVSREEAQELTLALLQENV